MQNKIIIKKKQKPGQSRKHHNSAPWYFYDIEYQFSKSTSLWFSCANWGNEPMTEFPNFVWFSLNFLGVSMACTLHVSVLPVSRRDQQVRKSTTLMATYIMPWCNNQPRWTVTSTESEYSSQIIKTNFIQNITSSRFKNKFLILIKRQYFP